MSTNPVEPGLPQPISRVTQLVYMSGITLLCLGVASLLFRVGYNPPRSNPIGFWGIEAGVVAVSFLWALYDQIERFFQTSIFQARVAKPTKFLRWWQRHQDAYSRWLVILCVIANMVAIWLAIRHTGGAIESPFAPMLAAPALFGSFVAQSRTGMYPLLIVSSAIILYLDATAKATAGSSDVTDSKRFTYGVVTVGILVTAGLISTFRIRRDEQLAQDAGDGGLSPVPPAPSLHGSGPEGAVVPEAR